MSCRPLGTTRRDAIGLIGIQSLITHSETHSTNKKRVQTIIFLAINFGEVHGVFYASLPCLTLKGKEWIALSHGGKLKKVSCDNKLFRDFLRFSKEAGECWSHLDTTEWFGGLLA